MITTKEQQAQVNETTKRSCYVIFVPKKGYAMGKKSCDEYSINLQRARIFGRKSDATQALQCLNKEDRKVAGILTLKCKL